MAEKKLRTRCKLCQLIQTNQALWIQVHDRIIREGDSQANVCRWLNERMEVLTAGKKKPIKFYPANFATHFTKHIPTEDRMKIELNTAVLDSPASMGAFTEEERALADAVGDIDENAEEYKEYPGIIETMEQVILEDLKDLTRLKDSNKRLNFIEAEKRLRIISQLLAGKQRLFEVQKSESIGGSAVKDGMMQMSHSVIDSSQKLAAEIREALRQQLPGSSFPEEVYQMIMSRIVETLKSNFAEIYGTVLKRYGLKA